jgi:hypothetical protein
VFQNGGIFKFGNRKVVGVKAGEKGRWGMTGMLFLAKNSLVIKEV